MDAFHFFVGAFFYLAPGTNEQQSSSRYQSLAMLTSTRWSKLQSSFPFLHQSSSRRLFYGVSGGSCPELSCLQCFLADQVNQTF